MRSTFLKILFSIAFILTFLVGLERLYDFGLSKNANIKLSFTKSANMDADVLVHGPCEPLWMVYPKLLDLHTGVKSYNLALSHSDFADNFLHLYLYLKHNKAPTYLYLFVTPESMDYKYNTFHSFRFAPYLGDPVIDSVVKEVDPDYFVWCKFPFMRYAYYSNYINFDVLQGLKHYVVNKTTPRFPDGYEPPHQRVWDNHLDRFMVLYPHGYVFKWGARMEKYLRKIIILAQEHNVKVVLYESPVLEESMDYQANRKEITDRVRDVAAEYGVSYVQFEGMEMAKSRRYFTSPLNTTIEGAKIFTDSLGQYIKKEIQKEREGL